MQIVLEIVAMVLRGMRDLLLEGLFAFLRWVVEGLADAPARWLRLVGWVLAGAAVGAVVGLRGGSTLAIYHGVTWENLYAILPGLIGRTAVFGALLGFGFGLLDIWWQLRSARKQTAVRSADGPRAAVGAPGRRRSAKEA